MSTIAIHPFTEEIGSELVAHFQRHRKESGMNGIHFMPFTPDDPDGPKGISIEEALLPLDTTGWQRWFYARDSDSGDIIGHVDLKGYFLKTGLHRCQLGIGIENKYRHKGLGERLMETAINFARKNESLSWIELSFFSNNLKAQALYKKFGFEEVGVLKDRFRILDEKIDDVTMVLNVDQ